MAIKRSGPAYIANAIADVLAAPASTMVRTIRHIHVANKTGTAATFDMYMGATGGSAGGTELFKTKSVPANDAFDYMCYMAQKSADFLSAVASAASTLVITIEYDEDVIP